MGFPYPLASNNSNTPASTGWGADVQNPNAPDGGNGPGNSHPYAQPICIRLNYRGPTPRFIAEAKEKIDKVEGRFTVKCADDALRALEFGQDITHGTGGKLPHGSEVPREGGTAAAAQIKALDPKFVDAEKAVKDAETALQKAEAALQNAGGATQGSAQLQGQRDAAKKALAEAQKNLRERSSNDAYEITLRQTIATLPKAFDKTGKAAREFDEFLKKSGASKLYTDPELDKTIAADENFIAFSEFTLNDPKGKHFNPGATRIHQALEKVHWDINQVVAITDLGTIAFNRGYALLKTDNYSDGLKIMINTVTHVLVFVSKYHYDSCEQKYDITLTFELYDSFGLDDEDIEKFGYLAHVENRFSEHLGFTAWWQLQHQFNYAPPVTKAVIIKDFSVSTRP